MAKTLFGFCHRATSRRGRKTGQSGHCGAVYRGLWSLQSWDRAMSSDLMSLLYDGLKIKISFETKFLTQSHYWQHDLKKPNHHHHHHQNGFRNTLWRKESLLKTRDGPAVVYTVAPCAVPHMGNAFFPSVAACLLPSPCPASCPSGWLATDKSWLRVFFNLRVTLISSSLAACFSLCEFWNRKRGNNWVRHQSKLHSEIIKCWRRFKQIQG